MDQSRFALLLEVKVQHPKHYILCRDVNSERVFVCNIVVRTVILVITFREATFNKFDYIKTVATNVLTIPKEHQELYL